MREMNVTEQMKERIGDCTNNQENEQKNEQKN